MSDSATPTRQDSVFFATDPVSPLNGYMFDVEDIEELGLDLCIKAAERTKGRMRDGKPE